MQGNPAILAKRLQFCAGPESHVFFACAEHAPQLVAGEVTCFFATADEPPVSVPQIPDDPTACYFCQEGGYE